MMLKEKGEKFRKLAQVNLLLLANATQERAAAHGNTDLTPRDSRTLCRTRGEAEGKKRGQQA